MTVVRAAAVQAPPVYLDKAGSTARAVELLDRAKAAGAHLVAFAESWLPGYPEWLSYGVSWYDDRQPKALFARLARNSVTVRGPEVAAIAEAAGRLGLVVVLGISERDDEFSGGTLFNTVVFIDERGRVRHVHRKPVPTYFEKMVWGLGDASGLRVLDSPTAGRVAAMLCWENWMPLARFVLHAQGEQIHVALWPDLPEFNVLATRSYAFEGRCFVVSAGTRLLGSDLPEDVRGSGAFGPEPVGDERVLLKGGSTIAGPDGTVIATAALEDDLLVADLDLDLIVGEQQLMDVAGHYNRPDLFELTVHGSPTPQVTFRAGDPQPPGVADGVAGTGVRDDG
jgi:predicted amidohydrolase